MVLVTTPNKYVPKVINVIVLKFLLLTGSWNKK